MISAGYVFAVSLGLTVLFEAAAAAVLKIRKPKDLLLVVLVNILTNPPLVLTSLILYNLWRSGPLPGIIIYAVLEPLVIWIEIVYYKKYLEDGSDIVRKTVVMNLVSILGGLLCRNMFY